MADKIEFDIEFDRKGGSDVDRVKKDLKELTQGAREYQQGINRQWQAQKIATSQTGAMSAALTKAGAATVALGAAMGGLKVGYEVLKSLNEATVAYEKSAGELERTLGVVTDSAAAKAQALTNAEAAIASLHKRTGTAIPQLQSLYADLALKTGDASVAAQNLERAYALASLKGDDFASVAKDLGEVLDGDIGSLKEAGIISDSTAEALNKLGDRTAITANALGELDKKLAGVIDGMPKGEVASNKLASSWERLKKVGGDMTGASGVMGLLADGLSGLADGAEDWANAWANSADSISGQLRRVHGDLQAINLAAQSGITRSTPADLEKRRGLEQVAEQNYLGKKAAMLARFEQIEDNNWNRYQKKVELQKLENQYEDRLLEIRMQYPDLAEQVQDVMENQTQAKLRQYEIAKTTNPIEAETLKLADKKKTIEEQYSSLLAKTTDEKTKQRLLEQQLADISLAEIETENRLRDIRKRRYEQAKREREARAKEIERRIKDADAEVLRLEREHMRELSRVAEQNARRKIAEREFTEYLAKQEEERRLIREKENAAALKKIADDAAAQASQSQQDTVMARRRLIDRNIANIGAGFTGAGAGFAAGAEGVNALADTASGAEIGRLEGMKREGQDALNKSIDERIERIRKETAAYKEQQRAIAALGEESSKVAAAFATMAQSSWSMKEGSEAATSALQASVGVAGMVATALDASTKQQAGIQAAFHGAAAIGALALGIATGAPNYFAAAAKHGVAAVQFGIVAGTSGGTNAAAGNFSGGAGGAAAGGPSIDLERERQATADAIAGALNTGGPASGAAVIIDMRGATVLENDETLARRLTDMVQRDLRDRPGRRL